MGYPLRPTIFENREGPRSKLENPCQPLQSGDGCKGEPQYALPEVVVHGFEEVFIVRTIEGRFQVVEGDAIGGQGQLHQVGRVLVVQVVYHLRFPHRFSSFDVKLSTSLYATICQALWLAS